MTDFSKIYNDYYKRSFAFVKSYVFDDMATEDIVSESLVALWKVMRERDVEHPLSLLLTILKNNSLNYLKMQERRVAAMESMQTYMEHDVNYRINSLSACDPSEVFSTEINDIIERTLSTLSPQTREIFEMSRYENRPVKEIAESCHLTDKAVEYHISKALKALRIALKDYLPAFYWLFI
jgi:RNA polymerase sigma-70 factor (ECF subfamily)